MAHGAGGKATQTLIEGLFVPAFGAGALEALGDAGSVTIDGAGLALTTDSFVVKPIRFPGGSIGELAVNGTVNDLAVSGARPVAMSLSLVLEEGLAAEELRAEVEAIAGAARAARGRDRGRRHQGGRARPRRLDVHLHDRARPARPARGPLPRGAAARATACWSRARSATTARRSCWPAASSGSRPRSSPTRARCGRPWTRCSTPRARAALHARRDPRRSRVGLNELARASGVAMVVREADVPVDPAVAGAAELLGIDPMYVANEGKLVAFVAPDAADAALEALRAVPGCERATEIGEVKTEPPGMVLVETRSAAGG